MAKVYGPLHSDDARGKIAKSLVFIGWKGIKTVRGWLKPTNPKSTGQGNIRCILGGLGRAVGKVGVGSAYHEFLKTKGLIPDQQSKQSYLVQYIKDNFLGKTGALMTADFKAQLAALTGHTASDAWKSAADDLNLLDFSLTYDTIPAFDKALGLFLLGQAAIQLEFTGLPYTTPFASWTASMIDMLVADMAKA